MFTKKSAWSIFSGVSDDDHVFWFGANDASFPIEVTIDVIQSAFTSITSAVILPPRYSPDITISGTKQVKITIKKNGYYYVEINSAFGRKHPLFIFVDPPLVCPDKNQKNLLYYSAGYHDIGAVKKLLSGTSVFLEPGAFLEGSIEFFPGDNQSIQGRGLIFGGKYETFYAAYPSMNDPSKWYNGIHLDPSSGATNTTFSGILIVNPNGFCTRFLMRSNVKAEYLKCIAWRISSDGMEAGPSSTTIKNCFLKQNDDTLKLYNSNAVFENIVIFKQNNGAVFQFSWGETNNIKISNGVIRKIDVVRTTLDKEYGINSIFGVSYAGAIVYDNFYFEDIQVYDDVTTVFGFKLYSKTGLTPAGQFSNFYFKNVRIQGTETKTFYNGVNGNYIQPVPVIDGQATHSYFYATTGDGSFIKQFTFEDVYINGACMHGLNEFPNGGAKTYGDVTGFTFKCN